MKALSIHIKQHLLPSILLICLAVFAGCTEDTNDLVLKAEKGMLQFRLYKKTEEISQKSATSINSLATAKKIKVVLLDEENNTLTQTVSLESVSTESSEFGLTSESLDLLEGTYTFIGYFLYDEREEEILSGEPDEKEVIRVVAGGLTQHEVKVRTASYGKVKFTLRKSFAEMETRSSGEAVFPFRYVREIDIKIKNLYTNKERTLENIPVTYVEGFDGTEAGTPLTSIAETDTIISLEAGKYTIIQYQITNKGGGVKYDTNSSLDENEFVVTNNTVSKVDVPIRISKMAEHIQDYLALKSIWEALDGKNWSFVGDAYPRGTNWNFNKDIDMWGEQPGVTMSSSGRVIGITIGRFGPKGVVPDEIGMLTDLKTLILGDLSDVPGNVQLTTKNFGASSNSVHYDEDGNIDRNKMYYEKYAKTNVLATFSDIIQENIAEIKGVPYKYAESALPELTPRLGTLTNEITGISDEIEKLINLTTFGISNSPITDLPEGLAKLPKLTDVQVANCPNMTKFPEVLTRLPELIALNIAMNTQMPAEEIYNALDKIATFEGSKSTKTIQLLYLGYNNLTALPESFKNLEKLGGLDCVFNKIEVLPALTKAVAPVQLNFSNNNIHTIETDADGNFCNIDDIETISLANNKLTNFPDIFDAKSFFKISTIDLSNNLISNIETKRGVHVEVLSLSGNKLTTFPSSLFDSESIITFLNLNNNNISTFPKNSFQGKNSYYMTALDLSRNYLSNLSNDLNNVTLPYLNGFDVSFNRFKSVPTGVLNIKGLGVLGVRHQRDENGYRCLKNWPTGIYIHLGLRALWLGGNDIGKVPETEPVSSLLNWLDISDNPNIIMDLSSICSKFAAGRMLLMYDSSQDLRGCNYLNLDK